MKLTSNRMIRRSNIGWLALVGLSGLCLAIAFLHAVGFGAVRPMHLLWAACCPSAEGPPGELLSVWLPTGAVMVEALLLVSAASNLAIRIVRSRRLISQLLDPRRPMPWALQASVEELGLQGRVRVVDAQTPFAFCYGFVKPAICLSTALVRAMSPAQIRAVLLHERHHLQRRHPLLTLATDSLAATYFFLPIVGELRDLLLAQVELKADQAAIRGAGKESLAGALYLLLTQEQFPTPQRRLALNALSATQARIDQILTGAPLHWRPSLQAIASAAGAASMMCLLLMGAVG